MPHVSFERLFKSDNAKRDKFLSRLFGVFNEEIVRLWCNDGRSPYENLGRPTLRPKPPGGQRGDTLDFTLRSRQDGRAFVAELKCELEFESYRYLRLVSPSQLGHHTGRAFAMFLDLAEKPDRYHVTVGGESTPIAGAILIWGSVAEEGRASVIDTKALAYVLSLEDITNDLVTWGNQPYIDLIQSRADWCQRLFLGLQGNHCTF